MSNRLKSILLDCISIAASILTLCAAAGVGINDALTDAPPVILGPVLDIPPVVLVLPVSIASFVLGWRLQVLRDRVWDKYGGLLKAVPYTYELRRGPYKGNALYAVRDHDPDYLRALIDDPDIKPAAKWAIEDVLNP